MRSFVWISHCMSTPEIGSADQLNEQLYLLLGDTRKHFSKRRKLLLQLERRNNELRRAIHRLDLESQKKVTDNYQVIQRIKKTIIEDDRQQSQRRRHELEQHRKCSSGTMVGTIAIVTFVVIMIMIILDRSREKYI